MVSLFQHRPALGVPLRRPDGLHCPHVPVRTDRVRLRGVDGERVPFVHEVGPALHRLRYDLTLVGVLDALEPRPRGRGGLDDALGHTVHPARLVEIA